MTSRRLYIVEKLSESYGRPFLVIEKMETVDGFRDRITNNSFPTFDEAETFVKEHSNG